MQEDLTLPERFVELSSQSDRVCRILQADYTMAEIEYKPVAGGSDRSSRDTSLELKTTESRIESYEDGLGEEPYSEKVARWSLGLARRLRGRWLHELNLK